MTAQEVSTLNALVTFAAENMPGGLSHDEQEVARIVGTWAIDRVPVRPVCPHCQAVAPYGEERLPWLQRHINSPVHGWAWALRKKVRRTI